VSAAPSPIVIEAPSMPAAPAGGIVPGALHREPLNAGNVPRPSLPRAAAFWFFGCFGFRRLSMSLRPSSCIAILELLRCTSGFRNGS